MDKQKIKDWAKLIPKLQIEYHKDYSFRATLYKDDQLFATGVASLSETHQDVAFVPEFSQKLDTVLYGSLVLKLTGIDASLNLRHSQEYLELSTEAYWIFERVPEMK